LNDAVPEETKHLLASITRDTLHGFYYRISTEFWRKVEAPIYLRRRVIADDAVKGLFGGALYAKLFGDGEAPKFEFSFLSYDNFTKPDGTPDVEAADGFRIVAHSAGSGDFADLKGAEWRVIDREGRQHQHEKYEIDIVTADGDDDDIYAAFRRYWSSKKRASFAEMADALRLSEEQRAKLIVDTNNGFPFLMLGLGTGGLNAEDSRQSMDAAINAVGYRAVDGAEAYENEAPLGVLLRRESADRDGLAITSKVWPTHLGFTQSYHAVLDSLNRLGTAYLDLYLIHWNRCDPAVRWMHCESASGRPWGQSWELMERLYAEGVLLSIGVSNYNFADFNELLSSGRMQIVPQVLQNYCDLAHMDWDFAEYVRRASGTVYQGYACFRGIAEAEERSKRGESHYALFERKLLEVSQRSTGGKASASQVLLRFLLEMNIATIPRSADRQHLTDNLRIWDFELTQQDVAELLALSKEQNFKMRHSEL